MTPAWGCRDSPFGGGVKIKFSKGVNSYNFFIAKKSENLVILQICLRERIIPSTYTEYLGKIWQPVFEKTGSNPYGIVWRRPKLILVRVLWRSREDWSAVNFTGVRCWYHLNIMKIFRKSGKIFFPKITLKPDHATALFFAFSGKFDIPRRRTYSAQQFFN